jgi:virginiamycin B lyase
MDMQMDMPGMQPATNTPSTLGIITEYSLNWPGPAKGSTHELVINNKYIFVTGQLMNKVAKFSYDGKLIKHLNMPDGSNPHGLLINKKGQLWVSFESFGTVARINQETGVVEEEIDVKLYAQGAAKPINTAPHGIGLDADGETMWFTGKRTSTLGKINPNRTVEHFELPSLAALPIFLSAGVDGGIWGTELNTSSILHKSKDSDLVKEYVIPGVNTRPIAIIPDPDPAAKFMWYTTEAGGKVGKMDMSGNIIAEFAIPAVQKNYILASLAFDNDRNLWVQAYVNQANPVPAGNDYIIRFDKSIRDITNANNMSVASTRYDIPSRLSMMHRIRPDFDGNLWFTEMMTDKLGKITLNKK